MKRPLWVTSGRIFALLWLVVIWGCGPGEPPKRLEIGGVAPKFKLPSLDGIQVTNESLKGEVVVLNFWATWCQPCLKEIPELKEMAATGRATIVGIALDEEGATTVRPFVERHDINYTVLLGNQEVFQRYSGFSIPYTVVLDASQQIINLYRGPTTQSDLELDLAKVNGT